MNRSFLLVEDNTMVAASVARMLQPLGTTTVVSTVSGGVRELDQRADWTALFVDIALPDGSGLDVLAHARETRGNIPALVMTGGQSAFTINGAFDLGASFICKPIAPGRLTAFVEQCALRAEDAAARWDAVVERWRTRYELTPSETEILRVSVRGASREEIRAARGSANGTIIRHVKNILQKTGDASLMAAIHRVFREAL